MAGDCSNKWTAGSARKDRVGEGKSSRVGCLELKLKLGGAQVKFPRYLSRDDPSSPMHTPTTAMWTVDEITDTIVLRVWDVCEIAMLTSDKRCLLPRRTTWTRDGTGNADLDVMGWDDVGVDARKG